MARLADDRAFSATLRATSAEPWGVSLPACACGRTTTIRRGRMKSWIGRGAAALCIFTPLALQAQETPKTENEDIDEVLVTATKRSTTLQEVPFSVAALTAEDLKESGATNIVDVA